MPRAYTYSLQIAAWEPLPRPLLVVMSDFYGSMLPTAPIHKQLINIAPLHIHCNPYTRAIQLDFSCLHFSPHHQPRNTTKTVSASTLSALRRRWVNCQTISSVGNLCSVITEANVVIDRCNSLARFHHKRWEEEVWIVILSVEEENLL